MIKCNPFANHSSSKTFRNFATNTIPSCDVTNINHSCCFVLLHRNASLSNDKSTQSKPTENTNEIRCKSSRLQQSNSVINLTKRRLSSSDQTEQLFCLQLQQPASLLLLFRLGSNYVSLQSRCSESTTTMLRSLML